MADAPALEFSRMRHPAPVPSATRDQAIADPGFGKVFTDHMVTIDWSDGHGWHNATLGPRGPLTLDPAAAVLHYAQEIFEGMKAYKLEDGSMALFRPDENARRFNRSAQRMAMPEMPEEAFVEAVRQLVLADAAWFPPVEGGSLYLRPFMFASEAFLGVRPAKEYKFLVIATAAGNYFKAGVPAVSIWVSKDYTRAAPGGTGAAKCGGNYAASLLAQAEATRNGCDQVVFLDAVERKWIEELGGMNVFFVFNDGSLATPPLGGTILPGVTRSSLITLARAKGIAVREERYSYDQWKSDAGSGRLREAFACGTAAVVTPIGTVRAPEGEFRIGNGGSGARTEELKSALVDIQRCRAPDTHGWIHRVF